MNQRELLVTRQEHKLQPTAHLHEKTITKITQQEKSNGLLEVTALISEGGRTKDIPGTAFRKMGAMARNVFASPAPSSMSSPGSSVNPFTSSTG